MFADSGKAVSRSLLLLFWSNGNFAERHNPLLQNRMLLFLRASIVTVIFIYQIQFWYAPLIRLWCVSLYKWCLGLRLLDNLWSALRGKGLGACSQWVKNTKYILYSITYLYMEWHWMSMHNQIFLCFLSEFWSMKIVFESSDLNSNLVRQAASFSGENSPLRIR